LETEGPSGNGKPTSGRRRGRRRGVEIRPGSVKEARQQAGLSLGQVARQDISRTAIYFVEVGKAKPSMETLELIAERTGHPLHFFLTGDDAGFLHPQAKIAELERLLVTGDNAGVVAVAEAALGQRYDAQTEARIRLLASLAYLRLAQPIIGRRMAVAARAFYEQAGDLEAIADCLGNEASAAMLTDDPAAVTIAEGALATCRSVKPVPQTLEARLLGTLGNSLVTRNRWQEAIDCYEEAIAGANVVHDLKQLSLLYSGLSMAHMETGQIHEATRYAQKALALHETLNDRLSQARSLNNLGYMLVRLGEFAAARRNLDRALRIFEEQGVEVRRSDIILSFAELEFAENDLRRASMQAHKALELANRLDEKTSVAEAHALLGRIAERHGRFADADAEFSAAVAAADASGSSPRTMQVHEAYAEILEARGDLVAANGHLKKALAASRPATPAALESRIAIA
jgi:tetratricopeptide (TPR) repeat protein/DNA-binding XRE family transcriptional regulator